MNIKLYILIYFVTYFLSSIVCSNKKPTFFLLFFNYKIFMTKKIEKLSPLLRKLDFVYATLLVREEKTFRSLDVYPYKFDQHKRERKKKILHKNWENTIFLFPPHLTHQGEKICFHFLLWSSRGKTRTILR